MIITKTKVKKSEHGFKIKRRAKDCIGLIYDVILDNGEIAGQLRFYNYVDGLDAKQGGIYRFELNPGYSYSLSNFIKIIDDQIVQ